MIRKQYVWKTLVASLIFILLPFYFAVTLRMNNVNDIIANTLGGGVFSPSASVQSLLTGFIPALILFFLFSDFFSSDFEAMSVYIFTRASKPMKYLARKAAYLAACILGYTVLNALLCFIVGVIAGSPMQNIEFTIIIGSILVFFLNNLVMVGLINLLALWIKCHYSFLIVSIVYMLNILIFLFLNPPVQKIVCYVDPFLQGFYSWHFENVASGFYALPYSVSFSVVYLLAVLLLEYFLFYRHVKQADYL